MTQLDENYSVKIDKSYALVFQETRKRYDKKQEKQVEYLHSETDYFPSLEMALNKYKIYRQNEAKNIDQLIEISKDIRSTLKVFSGIYFKENK